MGGHQAKILKTESGAGMSGGINKISEYADGQRTRVAYYGQPRATMRPTPFSVPQAKKDGKIDRGWLDVDVPGGVASDEAMAAAEERLALMEELATVAAVVGTHADLQALDVAKFTANDFVRVQKDETQLDERDRPMRSFYQLSPDKSAWVWRFSEVVALPAKSGFGTDVQDDGTVDLVPSTEMEPTPALPVGGTQGQVLTKTDATDFNVKWEDPKGGGGGSGLFGFQIDENGHLILTIADDATPNNFAIDFNTSSPTYGHLLATI
jgi:hypothetical protein